MGKEEAFTRTELARPMTRDFNVCVRSLNIRVVLACPMSESSELEWALQVVLPTKVACNWADAPDLGLRKHRFPNIARLFKSRRFNEGKTSFCR